MLSTLFLRRFPKFSFETVPVFVGNKAGILHNIYSLKLPIFCLSNAILMK